MFSSSRARGPGLHQLEMFRPTQMEGAHFNFYILGRRSIFFLLVPARAVLLPGPWEQRAPVPHF